MGSAVDDFVQDLRLLPTIFFRIDFASKVFRPDSKPETQILSNRKPRMLALNVPTYITLFGYGYFNVYELDELVNVKDKRAVLEGTEVNR